MNARACATIALSIGVLYGCASTAPAPSFSPGRIDPRTSLAKVSDFVVLFDDSASMAFKLNGVETLAVERTLASALLATVPDLGYRGALRTFGQGPCLGPTPTSLAWGPAKFAADAASAAVQKVRCKGGRSPLYAALDAAAEDLGTAGGRKAVIVVSDGLQMGDAEVASAAALRHRYGDLLCIYAIQLGDSAAGLNLLQRVVGAAACGRVVGFRDLASPGAMEALVRDALVEPDSDGDGVRDADDRCPDTPAGVKVDAAGCPVDSDGDGVPDDRDRCPGTPAGVKVGPDGCPPDADGDGVPDDLDHCPGTPAGVKVDANGCPVDSDGDGVPDYLDRCPDTPRGTPVDAQGCPIKGVTVTGDTWRVQGDVLFDFNKATVREDAEPVLTQLADYLRRNEGVRVEIEGYTDSIGSDAYNLRLSARRAEAAKAFLVAAGVAADRLTTVGKGKANPVVPNDTEANRARNRRVEFRPLH